MQIETSGAAVTKRSSSPQRYRNGARDVEVPCGHHAPESARPGVPKGLARLRAAGLNGTITDWPRSVTADNLADEVQPAKKKQGRAPAFS